MPQLNFDASTVKPIDSFEPIPAGKYVAHITQSEIKPTKKNDGYILELIYEVINGEYKGRRIYNRLNISNPNPQAEEIAQRTLSSICHAINTLRITSSEQLHNKPHIVKVKITEDKGYAPKNEITDYEPYKTAVVDPTSSGPKPEPTNNYTPDMIPANEASQKSGVPPTFGQQSGNNAKPPWER